MDEAQGCSQKCSELPQGSCLPLGRASQAVPAAAAAPVPPQCLVPREHQLLPPALGALVPAPWYTSGFSVGKRQRGLSKAKDLLL